MLYTTYISNIKNIPTESIKLIITRYLPKQFNIKSYRNCFYAPILSPSAQLLKNYKQDNDWNNYVITFNKEMNNDNVRNYLSKVSKALDANQDVYLICYEKNQLRCHRTLIAELLKAMGYMYEEFKI